VKKQWRPPKSWIAWPLPDAEVPREWSEGWGPDEEEDEENLYRRDKDDEFGAELKDCLMGVVLKQVNCAWEERESEDGGEDNEGKEREGSMYREDSGTRSRSGSEDQAEAEDEQERARSSPAASMPPVTGQPHTILKPVVSTDDERSRILLEPTMNNALTQLDKLLLALHHARGSWTRIERRVSISSTTSESSHASRNTHDTSSEAPSKRGRGRPRNHSPSHLSSLSQERRQEQVNEWRANLTTRGRPRKQYPRLSNETQEEYLVRVARLQKKPLPPFAPPNPPSSSSQPSRSRSRQRHTSHGSVSRSRSRHAEKRKRIRSPAKHISSPAGNERVWRRKLGLRDWSEVLGMASIVGFDSSAIERATKRCVSLFGEGMDFIVLPSGASDHPADRRIVFQPGIIPDLGALSTTLDDRKHISKRRTSIERKTVDTCPVPNCERGGRAFSDKGGAGQKLEKHLRVVHGLGEGDMEDLLRDNIDEELEGFVHVDGFLREIGKGRGWRGLGQEGREGVQRVGRSRSEGERLEASEGEEEASQRGALSDEEDEASDTESDNGGRGKLGNEVSEEDIEIQDSDADSDFQVD